MAPPGKIGNLGANRRVPKRSPEKGWPAASKLASQPAGQVRPRPVRSRLLACLLSADRLAGCLGASGVIGARAHMHAQASSQGGPKSAGRRRARAPPRQAPKYNLTFLKWTLTHARNCPTASDTLFEALDPRTKDAIWTRLWGRRRSRGGAMDGALKLARPNLYASARTSARVPHFKRKQISQAYSCNLLIWRQFYYKAQVCKLSPLILKRD